LSEASDEEEVTAEEGDGSDVEDDTEKSAKSLLAVVSMLSTVVLSTVELLSVGLDSWSHWWSSIEGLFLVHHWWWSLTSVVTTVMLSSSVVLATVVWSALVVSSASSTLHSVDPFVPEALWLFLVFDFLFLFFLNEGR
jgi:hypothetical protein